MRIKNSLGNGWETSKLGKLKWEFHLWYFAFVDYLST